MELSNRQNCPKHGSLVRQKAKSMGAEDKNYYIYVAELLQISTLRRIDTRTPWLILLISL